MESTQRLGNNTYNETFGYDNGLRLTGVTLTRVSDGATLFASTPGYDAVNDVVSVSTTLPGGTDNQGFCYDEQDRLTWAATSGAKPCGGTVTAGTLSSAAYAQTFGYDNLNRLTSGPAGSYTYGDSAHLHAATAVGTGYTASYDAAGNMTCRAPTSSLTCSGTITGQKLSYDNEGRLTSWKNTQTNPTVTDGFLYDGDGNRIKQYSVVNGSGTTTVYVGGVVEYLYTGGTTTTTAYYQLGGQRIAVAVNGTLSYVASDRLSSTSVALDGAGNVTASQLFAPYGTSRYSNGTMPTDRGFTGQHGDAITGLDYYGARYYDPAVGQFSSADTVFDGLNRYAYVAGNPETDTDPSGTCIEDACIGEIALGWAIWTAGAALIAYVAAYDIAHPLHWPGWSWGESGSSGSTSTGRTATAREVTVSSSTSGTCDCVASSATWYRPARSSGGIRHTHLATPTSTFPHSRPIHHAGGIRGTTVPTLKAAPRVTLPRASASRAPSTILAGNMGRAGNPRPTVGDWAAHHIVPATDTRTRPARDVLTAFGIDINDAANGVWLTQAQHQPLHTQTYHDAINDELTTAGSAPGTTRDTIIDVIDDIRQRILGGTFP